MCIRDRGDTPLSILQAGQADAYMMDDVLLYGTISLAWHPEQWMVTGKPQSFEAYACILPKDDPAYKKVVDQEIARLMKSGEFEACLLYTSTPTRAATRSTVPASKWTNRVGRWVRMAVFLTRACLPQAPCWRTTTGFALAAVRASPWPRHSRQWTVLHNFSGHPLSWQTRWALDPHRAVERQGPHLAGPWVLQNA